MVILKGAIFGKEIDTHPPTFPLKKVAYEKTLPALSRITIGGGLNIYYFFQLTQKPHSTPCISYHLK